MADVWIKCCALIYRMQWHGGYDGPSVIDTQQVLTNAQIFSFQCGVCNQFFANARTHQNHSCGIQLLQEAGIPALGDVDILKIKTDRDKLSQQVGNRTSLKTVQVGEWKASAEVAG